MNDILLSICISSYNKGAKCCQLVRKILAIKDNRYNVFICDDCSTEETLQNLHSLHSSKVTLVRNRKNVGPCKNWFKTIDCGNGKYILQVMDRDDINVDNLVKILDLLEKHTVGAGYIGKSAMKLDKKKENLVIYNKGREAFLTMAGVPVHPTGFLINRMQWKKGNYQKFFYQYQKYGIYPHSYVLGRVAVQSDMLYMPVSFCSYVYAGENRKSIFYEKIKSKDYWWLPDSVMRTANQLILYLYKFADDEYKKDFVCRRFQDGLYRATLGYKGTASNSLEMAHYGLSTQYVSNTELFFISLKYLFVFTYVQKKLRCQVKNIRKELIKIWVTNLKDIITMP